MRARLAGRCAAACGLAAALLTPGAARAQEPRPARFAVTVGPEWLGTARLGHADALETGNGRSPLTLFRTESDVRGGLGLAASLGARVTGPLWLESWVRYHSARLSTRVTGDFEGAADATPRESVQSFQIEGGAAWAPPALKLAERVQLFATGGGGYVRQLHSGQTLVATGQSVYAGGGAVLSLPDAPGRAFRAGLRLDARAAALRRGAAFDRALHVAPALSASLVLRF